MKGKRRYDGGEDPHIETSGRRTNDSGDLRGEQHLGTDLSPLEEGVWPAGCETGETFEGTGSGKHASAEDRSRSSARDGAPPGSP